MTFEEYKTLLKRMKKGREVLEGKWASKSPQDKKLVDLWFSMSEQTLKYAQENGLYPGGENWEREKGILKELGYWNKND